MRAATSNFVSALPVQAICRQAGLEPLKVINRDVAGPQGISFDGAIIASGSTGVSVLWFNRASQDIEIYCAEPLQCSSVARSVVEQYLQ